MTGGIRLKASTNRVRTSIALQQTSIWTNTIGQEDQKGTNAAVEAHINAPTQGGGGGGSRSQRRQAAAQAVMQTGAFDTAVTSYESLLNIARSQGAVGGQNRGACKVCGQLGHLTKQCRNHLSAHFKRDETCRNWWCRKDVPGGGGAALLVPPEATGEDGDLSDLSDLSSDLSDNTSNSDSSKSDGKQRSKGLAACVMLVRTMAYTRNSAWSANMKRKREKEKSSKSEKKHNSKSKSSKHKSSKKKKKHKSRE